MASSTVSIQHAPNPMSEAFSDQTSGDDSIKPSLLEHQLKNYIPRHSDETPVRSRRQVENIRSEDPSSNIGCKLIDNKRAGTPQEALDLEDPDFPVAGMKITFTEPLPTFVENTPSQNCHDGIVYMLYGHPPSRSKDIKEGPAVAAVLRNGPSDDTVRVLFGFIPKGERIDGFKVEKSLVVKRSELSSIDIQFDRARNEWYGVIDAKNGTDNTPISNPNEKVLIASGDKVPLGSQEGGVHLASVCTFSKASTLSATHVAIPMIAELTNLNGEKSSKVWGLQWDRESEEEIPYLQFIGPTRKVEEGTLYQAWRNNAPKTSLSTS